MNRFQNIIASVGLIAVGAIGSLGLQAVASPHEGASDSEERCGPGGHGGKGLMVLGRAMSRLDLSEEQKQALSEAREDITAHLGDKRDELGEDRDEKIAAIAAGTLERKDVKADVKDKMEEAEESMLFVVDRVFDVYETLDATQRAELAEMLTSFAEHREERRGGHGRGPSQGQR